MYQLIVIIKEDTLFNTYFKTIKLTVTTNSKININNILKYVSVLFTIKFYSGYLFRRKKENVFFFSIIGILNTMAIEKLLLGILHGNN